MLVVRLPAIFIVLCAVANTPASLALPNALTTARFAVASAMTLFVQPGVYFIFRMCKVRGSQSYTEQICQEHILLVLDSNRKCLYDPARICPDNSEQASCPFKPEANRTYPISRDKSIAGQIRNPNSVTETPHRARYGPSVPIPVVTVPGATGSDRLRQWPKCRSRIVSTTLDALHSPAHGTKSPSLAFKTVPLCSRART